MFSEPRRARLKRMLAGLALTLLTVSCGGSAPDQRTDIPVQDPELVATGMDLYQANCASCHGADLRGTDRGPSHLSVIYEPSHHSDAAFLLAVQRGVQPHHWTFGPMPQIPSLTAEDVDAIVAFVREQQRIHGFEPYPP